MNVTKVKRKLGSYGLRGNPKIIYHDLHNIRTAYNLVVFSNESATSSGNSCESSQATSSSLQTACEVNNVTMS